MFDEIVNEFERMAERAEKADFAIGKAGKEDPIGDVEKQLPLMRVAKEKVPMFDTPEDAIAASKDEDLVVLKSFEDNLSKYVAEGI